MLYPTISNRLKSIASFVEEGSRVADIGSDHALLPTFLIINNVATSCIAGEVNDGPFQAAIRQVEKADLNDKIEVRLGNGLSVLKQKEVDTLCIAGMGGALITKILDEGLERVKEMNRLILQPNVSAELVRRWFVDHGWELITETILEEDAKIYEILVAVPGDPHKPYDNLSINKEWAIRMGPFLLKKPTSVLIKKWEYEGEKIEKIIKNLAYSHDSETKARMEQFEIELKEMREVLLCLQTENKSLTT